MKRNVTETWTLFENLREYAGDAALLENIARSLGTDKLAATLEYIARMFDVEITEDGDIMEA